MSYSALSCYACGGLVPALPRHVGRWQGRPWHRRCAWRVAVLMRADPGSPEYFRAAYLTAGPRRRAGWEREREIAGGVR